MKFRSWCFICCILLLVSISGCDNQTSAPENQNESITTKPLPTARLTIMNQIFTVELAYTQQSRQQGLMYREALGPDRGMLFIFKNARELTFHMNNCLIDLDILFMARNGEIVRMHTMKAPPPGEDSKYYSSDKPALYALELPAGTIASLKLEVGQRIEMPRRIKQILPEGESYFESP